MRNLLASSVVILIIIVGGWGCGGDHVGQPCHADTECQPLVCNAPYVAPDEPPQAGTCQHPAAVGGVCHRPAECEDGLTCVLPAGGSPSTGGTCLK